MRKAIFVTILIFSASCTSTQKKNWRQLTYDSTDNFFINSEGKTYNTMSDDEEDNDIVKANVLNQQDAKFTLLFTNSVYVGDTLTIKIFTTTSTVHKELILKLVGNKYTAFYQYQSTLEPKYFVYLPIDVELKLSSKATKQDDKIRGFVKFKGECNTGCKEKVVQWQGNFVSTVK
jgi:hypothetical protein